MRARGIDDLGERFFDATLECTRDGADLARAQARAGHGRVLRRGGGADRPGGPQRARARPRHDARAGAGRERAARGRRRARGPRAGPCARWCGALESGSSFEEVREPALRAAATATQVLEGTTNLSVSVIVGQIRSTATDLLTGIGLHVRGGDATPSARRRPVSRAAARRQAPDGWQVGHQNVVRPPIVARSSVVPQRGQAAPRLRKGMNVAGVHAALADRGARGLAQLAAQVVELLARSARPRPAAARAWPATASRRRAGCRRRRSSPDRAAAPSARSSRGRRARGTRRARPRRRPGPTWVKSGSITARPRRRLSRSAIRPPSANSSTKRSQPIGSSSSTIRPAIPRCRPEIGARRRSPPTGTCRAGGRR